MSQPSLMLTEANESPQAVARLLKCEADKIAELGKILRNKPPAVVTTAARGSSDHAATFFKYLLEIATGIPTASIGPSVASIYKTPLVFDSAVHFTVSQSGASPDIVALQAAAKASGAYTVAIVNVPNSPVGRDADMTIALGAGPENSVAATKSFITSAAALAAVVAAASESREMAAGVAALSDSLAATGTIDTEAVVNALVGAGSFYTLGRGPGLGIAMEAALKAKETAALHAEAFSTAEVIHGPMHLIDNGFPVVAFVPEDAALETSRKALDAFEALGGRTIVLSSLALGEISLVTPSTGCSLIDPLVGLLPYYRIIEDVTHRRGFDPDHPRSLRKVTETV